MKMKKQIAKVICKGVYTCVYDNERKNNQYVVYQTMNGKRKKLDDFYDFYHAMDYLANIVFAIENGRR